MRSLTPLDQLTLLAAPLRTRLADTYWITSVEEFVATARAANQQYGSGRTALAIALGITDAELTPIIDQALTLLPDQLPFDLPVEQELGTGLLLDQYQDLDAASFAPPTNLPTAVEPLFVLPVPRSQGARNSCVAFTLAAAFQILSRDPTELSEQFLYWACKEVDGFPGDVGTDPLKAVQVLTQTGICRGQTWPYAPAPVDHRNPGHGPPPDPARAEAPLRRAGAFQRLPATSLPALKAALAAGHPLLIGLPIWEHWTGSWQGATLGRLRTPLPGEQKGGGHAMCLVGYRDEPSAPGGGYFIVRNSWGSDWARENRDGPGYAHLPYRLIAEQALAAIALESVAAAPSRPGNVGSREELGGAQSELAALYAEASALHTRLGALVDRLATLVAATPPAVVPPPPPAEPTATSQTGSGPLVRLSGGTGPAAEQLHPNGISPDGQPLLQIDAASAARLAQDRLSLEPKERQNLYRAKIHYATEATAGTVAGIDQTKIAEARWAVVINATDDAALLHAIWPLIAHRAYQMGLNLPPLDVRAGERAGEWYYRHTNNGTLTLRREHWGGVPPVLIYRPGERSGTWLSRHGISHGPVDPNRGVPFYLLLLGRPGPLHATDQTYIPLTFQYELDLFWGVGRLCFHDETGQHRLQDYTRYAEQLVAIEQRTDAAARLRKEIVYLATRHDLDQATIRSADELVQPLVDWSSTGLPQRYGFTHRLFKAADATRTNVEQLLRGSDDGRPPAILFTASHGLGLPLGDPRLVAQQGSLVLQDWSGVGNVRREHWFAGEDLARLTGGPRVEGSFALLFACYGLGCPDYDEFIFDEDRTRPRIAPFPLIAQLPQQLLVHGALGVIGHVERAWTYSFSGTDGARAQSQPFEDLLGRLLLGRPAGDATDQFNMIQGQRAMQLTSELEEVMFGKRVDPLDLARLWVARNDARNYALLGDPAARLPYQSP